MLKYCKPASVLALLTVSVFFQAAAAGEGTRPIPKAHIAALLAPPLVTPASGNPDAKVTLVEFFDYQCPICRELEPDLKKLVDTDRNVRIVHKDLPVFGEASKYAAYCSYAAARLGKYQQAHDALMSSHQRLESKDAVDKVLAAAGFDVKSLAADIGQHERDYAAAIARNEGEAKSLGIRGTPGVIIGNQLVQGSLDYQRLEQLTKR